MSAKDRKKAGERRMLKKSYEAPEMEMMELTQEDIIRTSDSGDNDTKPEYDSFNGEEQGL